MDGDESLPTLPDGLIIDFIIPNQLDVVEDKNDCFLINVGGFKEKIKLHQESISQSSTKKLFSNSELPLL